MRRWDCLAMAVALAACSAFAPPPAPECDTARFDPPPTLTCEVAVDAALDLLPSHGPIAALQFLYGSLCPPNARCMAPDGSAGTVIITFGDGSQQSVYVALQSGRLVTEAPAPYPPSWVEG
jgi:hypothetical protein